MLHHSPALHLLRGQSFQALQDRGLVCEQENQQHCQLLPQRQEEAGAVCESWLLLHLFIFHLQTNLGGLKSCKFSIYLNGFNGNTQQSGVKSALPTERFLYLPTEQQTPPLVLNPNIYPVLVSVNSAVVS